MEYLKLYKTQLNNRIKILQSRQIVQKYLEMINHPIKTNKKIIKIKKYEDMPSIQEYIRLTSIISMIDEPLKDDISKRIEYLNSLQPSFQYDFIKKNINDNRVFYDDCPICAWLELIINNCLLNNIDEKTKNEIYNLYFNNICPIKKGTIKNIYYKIIFNLGIEIETIEEKLGIKKSFLISLDDSVDNLKPYAIKKIIFSLNQIEELITDNDLKKEINDILQILNKKNNSIISKKNEDNCEITKKRLIMLIEYIKNNKITKISDNTIVDNINMKIWFKNILYNKYNYSEEIQNYIREAQLLMVDNINYKDNYKTSLHKVIINLDLKPSEISKIFQIPYIIFKELLEDEKEFEKNIIDKIINGLLLLKQNYNHPCLEECLKDFYGINNQSDIEDNNDFIIYRKKDIMIDDIKIILDENSLNNDWTIKGLICLSIIHNEKIVPKKNYYYEDGANIYNWLWTQRAKYNKCLLNEEQTYLFEQINKEFEKIMELEIYKRFTEILKELRNIEDLKSKKAKDLAYEANKILREKYYLLNPKEINEIKRLIFKVKTINSTSHMPNIVITSMKVFDFNLELKYLKNSINFTYKNVKEFLGIGDPLFKSIIDNALKPSIDKINLIKESLLKQMSLSTWRQDQIEDIKHFITILDYLIIEKQEEKELKYNYQEIHNTMELLRKNDNIENIIENIKQSDLIWLQEWEMLYKKIKQEKGTNPNQYNWYIRNFHLLSLGNLDDNKKVLFQYLQYTYLYKEEQEIRSNMIEIEDLISNHNWVVDDRKTELSIGIRAHSYYEKLEKKYYSKKLDIYHPDFVIELKNFFIRMYNYRKYKQINNEYNIIDYFEIIRISLQISRIDFANIIGLKETEWTIYNKKIESKSIDLLIDFLSQINIRELREDQKKDIEMVKEFLIGKQKKLKYKK